MPERHHALAFGQGQRRHQHHQQQLHRRHDAIARAHQLRRRQWRRCRRADHALGREPNSGADGIFAGLLQLRPLRGTRPACRLVAGGGATRRRAGCDPGPERRGRNHRLPRYNYQRRLYDCVLPKRARSGVAGHARRSDDADVAEIVPAGAVLHRLHSPAELHEPAEDHRSGYGLAAIEHPSVHHRSERDDLYRQRPVDRLRRRHARLCHDRSHRNADDHRYRFRHLGRAVHDHRCRGRRRRSAERRRQRGPALRSDRHGHADCHCRRERRPHDAPVSGLQFAAARNLPAGERYQPEHLDRLVRLQCDHHQHALEAVSGARRHPWQRH